MAQDELRTYRRRKTTRESGYHTCESTTGGECIILKSERILQETPTIQLVFARKGLELVELFEQDIGILAFGGYIRSNRPVKLHYGLCFSFGGQDLESEGHYARPMDAGKWNNIGFHKEISLDNGTTIDRAMMVLTIEGSVGNSLDFVGFDFDVVKNDAFQSKVLSKSFYQKTAMHIPYIFYLQSNLSITEHLVNEVTFTSGQPVVFKSCNRCGRFLPIDLHDEMNTINFSLHCKKTAPCVHSSFRSYTILNYSDLSEEDLSDFTLEKDADKVKVVSYFGHQLECKACKKFFVNAPLNPQRDPQQFKEDSLRRRAIEVLVNELQRRNLVHFEFEKKTKKQFSKHIWEKFGGRCFKCQRKVPFEEMHLDHTMPLAYLYRLDESATCLCSHHNSQKRDHFPVDYYTEQELERLSKITGLSYEQLHYRGVNEQVLSLLVDNVEWYFDYFLMREDYQKRRDGILTADKINDSLKRVIEGKVDLAEEYRSRCGHYPHSVTIG